MAYKLEERTDYKVVKPETGTAIWDLFNELEEEFKKDGRFLVYWCFFWHEIVVKNKVAEEKNAPENSVFSEFVKSYNRLRMFSMSKVARNVFEDDGNPQNEQP